jgi:hypothetical protein
MLRRLVSRVALAHGLLLLLLAAHLTRALANGPVMPLI